VGVWGVGVWAEGVGCGVWGVGCGVWGVGCGCGVWGEGVGVGVGSQRGGRLERAAPQLILLLLAAAVLG
jgi:hypothetical protein